MNQTKTKNEEAYFKSDLKGFRYNLVDISTGYLKYLLFHPEANVVARKKDNYSVIQYINIETLKSFIQTSTDIYNKIARLPRNNTYLNFGMGAGFLERVVKLHGKINLESVEWEEQDILFQPLRKHLQVDVDYICNNVYDDDFKIYECDKNYDYIILTRFFPLNKANSNLEQVKKILKKFKMYSNKIILIDGYSNYSDEVKEFFNTIQIQRLPKSEDFDHWVLDLSTI